MKIQKCDRCGILVPADDLDLADWARIIIRPLGNDEVLEALELCASCEAKIIKVLRPANDPITDDILF